MTSKYFIAFMLLALGDAAMAKTPPPGEDFLYTVRRGDTLIDLGRRGLVHETDYRIVQRRNGIGNPRLLPTGMVLRVPSRLLRRQPVMARIAALRGTVLIDGAMAQRGAIVGEGANIRTDSRSFVTLQLADGSLLTVPSGSRLQVLDLHRIALTGAVVKRFQLGNGRVETEVSPLKQRDDRFEVKTPVAVAAVRGTRFRVSYAETAQQGATEVLEGHVAVSGARQQLTVDPGQGVSVSPSTMSERQTLLPAPTALDMDKVQDSELVTFHLAPMTGAAGFRVQLATDAGFVDLFEEDETAGSAIQLPNVPEGSLFARFTALAPDGLEGMPTAYTFERRRNDLVAKVDETKDCPGKRCLRFRWQGPLEGERRYRFQLLPSGGNVPAIDNADMTAQEIVVTDLPGGDYRWRVESRSTVDGKSFAKWGDYNELHVTPLRR